MSDSTRQAPHTQQRAACFVHGQWRGEASHVVCNPADTRETVGAIALAGPETATAAISAASAAHRTWRRETPATRTRILAEFLDGIEEARDALATLITRENGKTLRESAAEIDAALRDGRYQLELIAGERDRPTAREVRYEPLGVFVLITPWNFPLATLVRKLVPALAIGNTVVVKPSELASLTVARCFALLEQAGLPPGVANLVTGEGPVVGPPLVDHHETRGVSFTGSTETGLALAQRLAGRDVRLQAEMGGKNALVVLADADLEAAADAAALAAFSCAGQWCTSTSRVICVTEVHDRMLEALADRARAIRVGNGALADTDMGPVISAARRTSIAAAIGAARKERARLVYGGAMPDTIADAPGHFVQPTIFADVTAAHALARQEVFGPVLAMMRARHIEDAVRLANATKYGLSFSIFTRDERLAERFVDEVEAGICHVNLHTAYREPGMPLGGWRSSGRGIPECGTSARDFYSRIKAIYRADR